MSKDNIKNKIEWKINQESIDFTAAYNFMEDRVSQIISGSKNQMIWLLEHQDVYTAGVSAKDYDLINKTNIPIFKTNRGGKYTYHGPGMKIIYVMLDLKSFFFPQKPDIAKFINFLENWIIATLSEYGITGEIRKDRVGIWVKDKNSEKKIAAIGVKIKKWVTYHGIALNLNPNLDNFKNIVPCGINNFGVTSLQELGIVNFSQINQIIKDKFIEVYDKDFCS